VPDVISTRQLVRGVGKNWGWSQNVDIWYSTISVADAALVIFGNVLLHQEQLSKHNDDFSLRSPTCFGYVQTSTRISFFQIPSNYATYTQQLVSK